MKEKLKKWIRPALFLLAGALMGLVYHCFVGCATGTCPITSNPASSMVYMSLIGWLLSGLTGKVCDGGCSI